MFFFQFLHLGRAISYGSYFYNPNTWFSGILIFFFLMTTAFMGYVLPFGQMSFWGATVITNDSQKESHPHLLIINYNSKREDLEEEDQRQDERNVIL